jgi:hypothetical protein
MGISADPSLASDRGCGYEVRAVAKGCPQWRSVGPHAVRVAPIPQLRHM